MATGKEYQNFDIVIEQAGDKFRARVIHSPSGQAAVDFDKPFSPLELENFVLRMGRPRGGMRRIDSPEMQAAKDLGRRLFTTVFSGEVNSCYLRSVDNVLNQNKGLRVRLHINAPEFNDLPWEFLYNPQFGQFVALSHNTPIIRYLELPYTTRALVVQMPLKILVMISSPEGYPRLDIQKEWEKLNRALQPLLEQGLVVLEKLEQPTLSALQRKLRQDKVHIFHYIGHGKYFEDKQDGMLLLEDGYQRGRPTSGQHLGAILHDHYHLRLVVLNACEGARTSKEDPYAGVAQTLVRQGIPAVLAMQFEIFEEAAMTFAEEFYSAIVDNYPVDAALSEARKAIFATGNDVEWGTPVLFMRTPDGMLFTPESAEERAARLEAERERQEQIKKEREEKIAREKAEREAAEKAARENAKREAAEKVAREKEETEAREKAEREAAEKAAKEKAEKEANEKIEREAAEKAAREKAEQETAEKAERKAAEKTALEKVEREAAEREKADLEAMEKAARQKAEREAAEQAAFEKAERETTEKTTEAKAEKKTARKPAWLPYGIGGAAILACAAIFGIGYLIQNAFLPANPTATNRPPTQTLEISEPTDTAEPQDAATNAPERFNVGDTTISEKDGMVMVYVPAGEFQMGSENGADDEKPVHSVYVDAFWIDQTEVTNELFVEFLNSIISNITVEGNEKVLYDGKIIYDLVCTNCTGWEDRISWNGESFKILEGYKYHPVALVTWYGAHNYCSWAGSRLPTEAEWEKAAGWDEESQNQRVYPWGNDFDCKKGNFDDETQRDEYVVPGGENCDGFDTTAPVGSFTTGASFYGVLDMSGNVWEWVADWYDSSYYNNSPGSNPLGPSSGDARVVRGGSWDSFDFNVRAADRVGVSPTYSSTYLGFRCSRSP